MALEQKQLASHLSTMLRDLPLLRSHYKRYAFLRYFLHPLPPPPVGLALEQKQLASHLSTMPRDLPLLRSHYKRYAFLRYRGYLLHSRPPPPPLPVPNFSTRQVRSGPTLSRCNCKSMP